MGQFTRTRRTIIDGRSLRRDSRHPRAARYRLGASLWRPRVLPPPFLGRHKSACPDAALGGFRLVLLRAVIPATAVGHSPAPPHQPSVEVGSVGIEAGRENAVVA